MKNRNTRGRVPTTSVERACERQRLGAATFVSFQCDSESTSRWSDRPRGVFLARGELGWAVPKSLSDMEEASWRRRLLDDASEVLDSVLHPLVNANITDASREDAFTDKVIKVRARQERRRFDRRSTCVGTRQFDALWSFPVRSARLNYSLSHPDSRVLRGLSRRKSRRMSPTSSSRPSR